MLAGKNLHFTPNKTLIRSAGAQPRDRETDRPRYGIIGGKAFDAALDLSQKRSC